MTENSWTQQIFTCEYCGNKVTEENQTALSCPACAILDEYGTLELPTSVYMSMDRKERRLLDAAFSAIPGYWDDKDWCPRCEKQVKYVGNHGSECAECGREWGEEA